MGQAQASDYLENQIIDWLFRSRTPPKPPALCLGFYTGAPSDAGGGVEVAGGAYARVNLPPLDTNWTATQGGTNGNSSGTGGQTTNAVRIIFASPTADWGTLTHYGIWDAPVGGNLLIWDALSAPRTVLAGAPPVMFLVGQLQIIVG